MDGGWSMEDIVWVPVGRLRPHPQNAAIYGAPVVTQESIESVRTHGILQPLLITSDWTVISGHTRLARAVAAGLAEVPCVFRDGTPEQVVTWLVHSNRDNRNRTGEVMANEVAALRSAGVTITRTGHAVEQIGVPRDTARRVIVAADGIADAEESGDTEAAEEIREALRESPYRGSEVAKEIAEKKTAQLRGPNQMVADALALAPKFDSIAKSLREIAEEIFDLAHEEDGGQALLLIEKAMTSKVEDVADKVSRSKPAIVCPKCDGEGCNNCGGFGWIPKGRIKE